MKNTKLIAAAAFVVGLSFGANPAHAGKGGDAGKIRAAINSGSVDAIIAEVEKAEGLSCGECITLVTALTEDSRYAVREVAGWWFAKRPAMAKALAEGFVVDLASGDAIAVRNAADFLGSTKTFTALPALRQAAGRNLDAEATLALVRAAQSLAHKGGKPVLQAAMSHSDAGVRAAAVTAWRDILDNQDAAPAIAMLGDADSTVRAAAAMVVGALKGAAGRTQLEALVIGDADPFVRRNAAFALGQIANAGSRAALTKASSDTSGLVRMTAKTALALLQ